MSGAVGESLRSMSSGRPHSPFEALLAVSGNIQSELPLDLAMPATLQKQQQQQPSPSHPSKQSTYSNDGGTMELLEDPLAERINRQAVQEMAAQAAQALESQMDQWPEGVGTSGGGESGDTANSSEISKAEADGYAKEECSEVRTNHKGGHSWGARSKPVKKQRMMWTPELHERFLNAVNHLGLKNAVPKTILRMMNVDGMTRENVASHLQKYRLHLKRQAPPLDPAAQASVGQRQLHGLPSAPPPGAGGLVCGIPVSGSNFMMPSSAQPPPSFGVPALGFPVSNAFAPYSLPVSMAGPASRTGSHIPPQAWAAGVPGYDTLQSLQSCQQGAALLMSLGPPASAQLPAAPGLDHNLDIAPLSTMPASSSAAKDADG